MSDLFKSTYKKTLFIKMNKDEMNSKITEENDLTKTSARYVALALVCLIPFGNYFVYDNPSALQTQLQDVKVT